MDYKLNKSAIDRVLRQTNAEPEELLEWYLWAVESGYDEPCNIRPFKEYSFIGGHYDNVSTTDLSEDRIVFAGISRDFYFWWDFLKYCRINKKYLKELITEYKQRLIRTET